MQPTREKIIEAVGEVMSGRQFQFEDAYNKGVSFLLSPGFGYVFVILILSVFLFFLIIFLKESFQGSEKKGQTQSVRTDIVKNELSLPNNPIERLHAAFLNSLQNRKIVTLKQWKTNSDYIKESENPVFQKVCVLYDSAVYGAKEISEESVSLLSEQFSSWEKQ